MPMLETLLRGTKCSLADRQLVLFNYYININILLLFFGPPAQSL